MPIAVDSYYPNKQSLNDIKEPYLEMLEQLENLYLNGPTDGMEKLSYTGFKNYCVVSAAWTISQRLKKNMATFVSTMLDYFDNILANANVNNLDFRSFWVIKSYERAVIFGCVYYILSFDENVPKRHLEKIEVRISPKDLPYFKIFKDAVEKVRESKRQQEIQDDATEQDVITKNLQSGMGKRIVLAERHNSDFTRVVQAMIQDGYFCHADKTTVTATEVGEMMFKLMGIANTWKSLLQKAFGCDNPLKTYDNLRDSGQRYWLKRAKIDK